MRADRYDHHYYEVNFANAHTVAYEIGFVHVGKGAPYMRGNPSNIATHDSERTCRGANDGTNICKIAS